MLKGAEFSVNAHDVTLAVPPFYHSGRGNYVKCVQLFTCPELIQDNPRVRVIYLNLG